MESLFLDWRKAVPQDASFQWMESKKPPSTPVEAACVCKSQDDKELCSEGSDCLNRITETYCTHHVCKNQMPNDCPDISIHNFGPKGWGIKSTRTIPSGTFICQYLGETLNAATVQQQCENNYVLRLGDIFIDAKRQGNQARLLNHACDPNCDLVKRNNGDQPCAVIITNRDILPNSELTIDYKCTSSGVKCLCGAPNCAKIIGRSSKERSQDRLNRDDDDSLRLNDSTQTPRLRSSLKRPPSPSLGESLSKRPRQAQLVVPPLGSAATVLSTSCGKSYASDVGGLPNEQDKNNYQQSTMRRPEARHKDQTILHEPPASLGNRPDPRSPSAVSSPRNNDSYFTILRVLKCNLSKFQKRSNERKDSRTSGVAKATDEPAPNLNDPTSIASHVIANPSALTLGPVSSTRDKTASPASREVSGAGGTELILDNRGSNARSLDSSGELINGPDVVLVAETMIGALRKERSQRRAIRNNNEELLLKSAIPPESSATDRVGPHASDVGGSLQECGIDSGQKVKKPQTRATLEPDDNQTERCEINPFTPSSPVQASFNRPPQPTASFESELLATPTIIKRHHTNPNFSSLSATIRGSRSTCDPRHHSGLEEVRDTSAVNASTQKRVPLPAQPANSAAFHHIHAGDPDVDRSSAMHGLPASSSPVAGSDANGENSMLHHLIERFTEFGYLKLQLSTFRSSSQAGPSESQGPLSALRTGDRNLILAPIFADMERKHQSELTPSTQLGKLPANPNDPTSISSQAPGDSGPFACGLVSCASGTNLSPASRQVAETERTDLIPGDRPGPPVLVTKAMTHSLISLLSQISREIVYQNREKALYAQILASLTGQSLNWTARTWASILETGMINSKLELILQMIAWAGASKWVVSGSKIKLRKAMEVSQQTLRKWLKKGERWSRQVDHFGAGVLLLEAAGEDGPDTAKQYSDIMECLNEQIQQILKNVQPNVQLFSQSLDAHLATDSDNDSVPEQPINSETRKASNPKVEQHACNYVGCFKGYERKGDLGRHIEVQHKNKSFLCDYQLCKEQFSRKDHCRDHLRDFHKEDLVPNHKTPDEKWWEGRSWSADWFRCSRCLNRRAVVDGWYCPGCSICCDDERKNLRKSNRSQESTNVNTRLISTIESLQLHSRP